MNPPNENPGAEAALLVLEKQRELLTQKKQVFAQELAQARRWFFMRTVFVLLSIPMLFGILALAAYILLHHKDYPNYLVYGVYGAVFCKFFGLLIWTHKAVFKQAAKPAVRPNLDDEK